MRSAGGGKRWLWRILEKESFLQRAAKLALQAAVYATAYPSVCPSVRHTPVLCQNEGTRRRNVYSRAVHISPHNSGTVIDIEKSWHGLSNEPRSCITPNFPKMGFRYPNLSFFGRNFDQKPLNVCYKVSLSKNFQQQSCSAINHLLNGINI